MKKEQIIVSFVTVIVGILMLMGATIAWYSVVHNQAMIAGMQIRIAKAGEIKVALVPGGPDISELIADGTEGNEYADMGVEVLTNIETGKLAPGAFGKVVFFITPSNENVVGCKITPNVILKFADGTWYSDELAGSVSSEEWTKIRMLQDVAGRHIAFFSDEQMLQEINDDVPYHLTWTREEAGNEEEKEAVIYWKWYYEYPFTEEENELLTEAKKKEMIDIYDEEDTLLGYNVDEAKFHFVFVTQ